MYTNEVRVGLDLRSSHSVRLSLTTRTKYSVCLLLDAMCKLEDMSSAKRSSPSHVVEAATGRVLHRIRVPTLGLHDQAVLGCACQLCDS